MVVTDTTTEPCHDCGVEVGTPHEDGCDVARCLWTGGQRLQCDQELAAACCRALRENGQGDLADRLAYHLGLEDPDHNCGEDIWTGEWPDVADAARLGFWCYWGASEAAENPWVSLGRLDDGSTVQVQRGLWRGSTWVRCGPNHPDARPDLTRLHTSANWDRETARWVAR